jgi:hypothetical protein
MTGDAPRRWDDDSAEEDAEVHRARELARLEQWTAEQKTRPLTDALESHGILPGDGQGWAGPPITPDWWDQVAEPHDQCPWCQRPGVPSPCGECRAAREQDIDPASLWAWWASLAPARRRLHIAASYGVDPWSGRRVRIGVEWTGIDAAGQIRTAVPRYTGCAPAGIYWGARLRA